MLSLALDKVDKAMSVGMEVKMSPNSTLDSGASSDDTGLALLPKNTRVVISGNNRTKRALVGQVAVVLRSVGLGGWHVCRLESGEEVKLQRNALSVLEYGPDEPQESSSDEMTEAREPHIEILTRPRIRRPPRSLSPVPDIFKGSSGMRPSITSGSYSLPLVNLGKLDDVSLKRYRRVFQLSEPDETGESKEDLILAVSRHFTTQVVEESAVLSDFRAALRRRYKQQQLLVRQYPGHFQPLHYGTNALYGAHS
jgi:histone deacetylase complex subunit SAP30